LAQTKKEDTKSWVGTEHKETTTRHDGNTTTTSTKVTGDSASLSGGISLRGNAGSETTTVTEKTTGILTTTSTETHTEGVLNVKLGGSKDGVGAAAASTAIEGGQSWTGSIHLGPLTIDLPSIGYKFGIGAGAKVNLGLQDGRPGISVKAAVGESLTVSVGLPSWHLF
jgi:hypothetical protein